MRISFFLWLVLYGILPVDLVLCKVHIPMVTKCLCCSNPLQESISYLLFKWELATQVWPHFNGIFSITWPKFIKAYCMSITWFNKSRSFKEFCYTLTPMIILWEIWKERFKRRFDEGHTPKPYHDHDIIAKVKFWLKTLHKIYHPTYPSSPYFTLVDFKLQLGNSKYSI